MIVGWFSSREFKRKKNESFERASDFSPARFFYFVEKFVNTRAQFGGILRLDINSYRNPPLFGRQGLSPRPFAGSARFFLCDFDVRHNRCISVLKLIPLGDNKVIIAVVDSYIEPVSLC